jgi:hypothetical protein
MEPPRRKGDADIFHRLALLCCSFFGRPRGRQEKCPRPLFFAFSKKNVRVPFSSPLFFAGSSRLGAVVHARRYWSQGRELLLMAITYNIMLL